MVIDLHSSFEHPRINKRFQVTEALLAKTRPASLLIEAQGSSPLQHMLWASLFGDYVTIYTALLNGENPAPIEIIEAFKKALDS